MSAVLAPVQNVQVLFRIVRLAMWSCKHFGKMISDDNMQGFTDTEPKPPFGENFILNFNRIFCTGFHIKRISSAPTGKRKILPIFSHANGAVKSFGEKYEVQ